MPSSPRVAALPARVGVETLRVALADATAELPAWRHPLVEAAWQRCAAALEETLARAEPALATLQRTRELETALTAVQDLLAPLEAFIEAERELAQ
ncbi:MAG: hypothetical protein ABR520_06965 [Mycobacteriales bacterium]